MFGYGQKKDGAAHEQTIDRCGVALRLYYRGTLERIAIATGVVKNGVVMTDAMRDFFLENSVPHAHLMIIPRGLNTAGEMDTALPFIGKDEVVVFVSTWYHIPRIVYLALWRVPWRRFKVAVAWRHAHPTKDVAIEFLKLGNALIRPLSWSKMLPAIRV